VRYRLVALLLVACGNGTPARQNAPVVHAKGAAVVATPADAAVVATPADAAPPGTYADLAEALVAIIPADARVIGFGELHSRVDRAQVKSSLSAFTTALPAFGDKISDLVVETWSVDPACGKTAVKATAQMEAAVKRPEATKSEIGQLADAAKKAGIQPHAMTLTCADYKTLTAHDQVDPIAMLTLTTRELQRIATSAVVHRDKQPDHRPWIAVYGGALHNDRFPEPGVAEWSYAAAADKVTHGHFVEIDLIVPELAAADAMSQKRPWFSLVETAGDRVQVWSRPDGDRSFVVVLPKAK
jgi:hypothetical protein